MSASVYNEGNYFLGSVACLESLRGVCLGARIHRVGTLFVLWWFGEKILWGCVLGEWRGILVLGVKKYEFRFEAC